MVSASTSGSARIRFQSKPGSFGTTSAVAGRVTASSRVTVLAPRRAPATAVSTVALVMAISRQQASSAGQRSRASRRSHSINKGIPLIAQAGRPKGQGC